MSAPLTAEAIDAARTPAGGWTKAQLAQWGVPWPPPKGWRKRLIADGIAVGKKKFPTITMIEAGVVEAARWTIEDSLSDMVSSVYEAMENQRRNDEAMAASLRWSLPVGKLGEPFFIPTTHTVITQDDFSVPRASRPLCAACHQETCHHNDLEYAGIVPEPEEAA